MIFGRLLDASFRGFFSIIWTAVGEERTLERNRTDLSDIALRQRVLAEVREIDLSADILGQRQALPIALGPVGLGGMYARRGEVQAARAARSAGVPFCLSTVSLCGFDEVAEDSGAAPWLQLYMIKDRAFMADLLDLAREGGSPALVFTVDMPIPGIRYRDRHSGMSGPYAALRRIWQAMCQPAWAWDVGLNGRPHCLGNLLPVLGRDSGMNDYMGWLGANFDPSIGWRDLAWVRERWQGPLVIKGILDPEDARAAVAAGADGIVVSNHGGRQLDGVLSSARALPAIADAVGDKATILADSGVRTGLDVMRMLASGANGVLLGRTWVYALAAAGEAGVAEVIEMIAREMRVAMTLSGVSRIDQINRAMIAN